MTITFDGHALFESGPASVQAQGTALRHAEQAPLHGQGARVLSQGRTARQLEQRGVLLADSPDALRQQSEAIEAYLDGLAHPLVDDVGRTWPGVVMLRFEPGDVEPAGVRWKLAYRVTYLETVEG